MSKDAATIGRRFLETLSEDGLKEAIVRHCAHDFTWWAGPVGVVEDPIGLAGRIDENLDDRGLKITISGVVAEGNKAAIECSSHGTLKNGVEYNNKYHFLFIVDDGIISEMKEYNDTKHVLDVWGDIL